MSTPHTNLAERLEKIDGLLQCADDAIAVCWHALMQQDCDVDSSVANVLMTLGYSHGIHPAREELQKLRAQLVGTEEEQA